MIFLVLIVILFVIGMVVFMIEILLWWGVKIFWLVMELLVGILFVVYGFIGL